MSRWSNLPPELLEIIVQKQTNYVDYISIRAVCKSWQLGIPKMPHHQLFRQLPWLLLPFQENTTKHLGFYNMSDRKTYYLELPEAHEKRCCGSSHGWLVMVEESPTIFLLNPLTKARIDLPSISTFPKFPTGRVFEHCQDVNQNPKRKSKFDVRDRFITKAIISSDPSLANTTFTVMVMYGRYRSLAFYRSGDAAWTIIRQTLPPIEYQDVMFHAGQFHVVDEMGNVSICDTDHNPPTVIHIASPPPFPVLGYKEWYLASLNEDLLLFGRVKNFNINNQYQTDEFVTYQLLEAIGSSNWLKLESLDGKIVFLGWNCSYSISASDSTNCKGNCIYFPNDNFMVSGDFVWEGHDFGVFDFDDGSITRFDLPLYPFKLPHIPKIFYHEGRLQGNWSVVMLPPPFWVTICP